MTANRLLTIFQRATDRLQAWSEDQKPKTNLNLLDDLRQLSQTRVRHLSAMRDTRLLTAVLLGEPQRDKASLLNAVCGRKLLQTSAGVKQRFFVHFRDGEGPNPFFTVSGDSTHHEIESLPAKLEEAGAEVWVSLPSSDLVGLDLIVAPGLECLESQCDASAADDCDVIVLVTGANSVFSERQIRAVFDRISHLSAPTVLVVCTKYEDLDSLEPSEASRRLDEKRLQVSELALPGPVNEDCFFFISLDGKPQCGGSPREETRASSSQSTAQAFQDLEDRLRRMGREKDRVKAERLLGAAQGSITELRSRVETVGQEVRLKIDVLKKVLEIPEAEAKFLFDDDEEQEARDLIRKFCCVQEALKREKNEEEFVKFCGEEYFSRVLVLIRKAKLRCADAKDLSEFIASVYFGACGDVWRGDEEVERRKLVAAVDEARGVGVPEVESQSADGPRSPHGGSRETEETGQGGVESKPSAQTEREEEEPMTSNDSGVQSQRSYGVVFRMWRAIDGSLTLTQKVVTFKDKFDDILCWLMGTPKKEKDVVRFEASALLGRTWFREVQKSTVSKVEEERKKFEGARKLLQEISSDLASTGIIDPATNESKD